MSIRMRKPDRKESRKKRSASVPSELALELGTPCTASEQEGPKVLPCRTKKHR